MKKVILILSLLLVASAVSAEQVYKATDAEATLTAVDSAATATSTSSTVQSASTVTKRLEVKSRNNYKFWRQGDEIVIKNYLKKYEKGLGGKESGNYRHLEDGLPQIAGGSGVDARHPDGRLRLESRPKAYQEMLQKHSLDLNGVDRYVDYEEKVLPAFNGGSSQGPLVLDAVPAVEKARSVAFVQGSPGAMTLSHAGDRQESAIATATRSWKDIPELKQPVCPPPPPPPPPPPGPYCPPGDPPVKPPTDPGTNFPGAGEPSWIEPNQDLPPGYVAPGGPPLPLPGSDQAPVVIGPPGNPPSWEPHLDDPTVADPVTEL